MADLNINGVTYNGVNKLSMTSTDGKQVVYSLDDSSVPDYWLSELETKADAIQQAMEEAGRNKSAFLWYTDAHEENNSKKSPILLKYLQEHTPMNKTNYGGDIVGDPLTYTHSTIEYVYAWRKRLEEIKNHHSVLGNHDANHHSADVRKMAYAFLIAPEESSDMVMGGDIYYYIDNPSERTRYLYLTFPNSVQADLMEQAQFIVDAIKSVEEGWHIVAIAHRWWQYNSASTPTVGLIPNYEKDVLSVFDAYNARAKRNDSNYFYAQDFSDAKGKVEFCIGGHIHYDYDFESDGGIPVIITTADTNQNRVPDSTVDSGTVGTITESAIYGIIANYNDPNNIKITVVGVGRGTSRIVRKAAAKPTSISNISYSGDTFVGEAIDKSKFSFTVTYSNGTTDTVTGATSVSPATIEAAGSNTVTITYTEGATTVSGTVTLIGNVAQLLTLDRTYVAGTTGANIKDYLDESKAYINAGYGTGTFSDKSCTVSGISENSITVKEPGVGGVCAAYAVRLPDRTKTYNLSFDYSGSGKVRAYYRFVDASAGWGAVNTIFNGSTAGASGHIDFTIPANYDYHWVVIFLGSNTNGTNTYSNVSLTKA